MDCSNIILITIESLRRDHFDQNRFPECWNVFQEDFTRFTDAYSNGVATPFSFPSIHTGQLAVGNGTLQPESPTIAETFPGYTWGVSNNPHLRKDRGYSRGFDYFADSLTKSGEKERTSTKKLKKIGKKSEIIKSVYKVFQDKTSSSRTPSTTAADLIDSLMSSIRNTDGFYWTHLSDSHYPFTPWKIPDKEINTRYNYDEIEEMNNRFIDECPTDSDIDILKAFYSELIKYIDRKLAEFFRTLRKDGRWDDSMIIIMSDHGEGFGENGIFTHQEEGVFSHRWDADPIDSLVCVPLLVKYPKELYSGEVFDHPVQNGDLLTTLTDFFDWNIKVPSHTQPFTETESRIIISKSNTAIRLTTKTGYAVRRQGQIKTVGEVNPEKMKKLEYLELPAVKTTSGDIPGLDEQKQEEIEQQLEYLGYKS